MTISMTKEQQLECSKMIDISEQIEKFIDFVLEPRIIDYNKAVGKPYPCANYSYTLNQLDCGDGYYTVPFVDRHEFETSHFSIPYEYAHMSKEDFDKEMILLAKERDQKKQQYEEKRRAARDEEDYAKMLELQARFAEKTETS